jgi:hypothetical protein
MKRAVVLMAVLMAGRALGQEAGSGETGEAARAGGGGGRPVTWSVRVPTELGFKADLDNSAGSVTVSRVGAELGVGIPIATMAQLELGFDYEYSRYEFSNATGFVAGVNSPWQDMHRETVKARFMQQHDMRVAWLVGGSIGLSHEEGADLGDSIYGSAYGGATYQVNEKLKIGGVLGLYTRIEDDPWVLIVPIVDWQIDDQWRLTNGGRPGLALYYTPDPQWTLSLSSWFDSRDFRLDDRGPVPGGVVRDQSFAVQFGATFRATQQITFDAGVGMKLFGNYELENAAGRRVADVDVDPSAFLSISATVRF